MLMHIHIFLNAFLHLSVQKWLCGCVFLLCACFDLPGRQSRCRSCDSEQKPPVHLKLSDVCASHKQVNVFWIRWIFLYIYFFATGAFSCFECVMQMSRWDSQEFPQNRDMNSSHIYRICPWSVRIFYSHVIPTWAFNGWSAECKALKRWFKGIVHPFWFHPSDIMSLHR